MVNFFGGLAESVFGRAEGDLGRAEGGLGWAEDDLVAWFVCFGLGEGMFW